TRFSRDWSSDVCSSDLPLKCIEHFIQVGLCDEVKLFNLSAQLDHVSDNQLIQIRTGLNEFAKDEFRDRADINVFLDNLCAQLLRSEERRVGKDCRAGWS